MPRTRPVAASAVLILALTVVPSGEPAWPRLIMAHGGVMEGRVLVDQVADIHAIMDSDEPYVGDVGARPSVQLTFFWTLGPVDGRALFDWMDKPRGDLVPEDADPLVRIVGVPIHGPFFPACGPLPAVIVNTFPGFDGSLNHVGAVRLWVVSAEALTVMERLGIPIEVDCSA